MGYCYCCERKGVESQKLGEGAMSALVCSWVACPTREVCGDTADRYDIPKRRTMAFFCHVYLYEYCVLSVMHRGRLLRTRYYTVDVCLWQNVLCRTRRSVPAPKWRV